MITLTPKEKKVFESIIALGCSEEEAFEVIESDRKIDKGEKIFDLDPELEKGAKKARQAPRKANATPTKRERKEDTDKRFLIQLLQSALVNSDNEGFTELPKIEITNPERQIDFEFSGRKFRIVLSAPRS
jgi:hypothetical protein